MFTNFDVKDILFGQFCSDNDDSTQERNEFTLVRVNLLVFVRNFSKSFLSTSLILTKGKNILPILTSHCKNKQKSNLQFHNTQNGIVFCL